MAAPLCGMPFIILGKSCLLRHKEYTRSLPPYRPILSFIYIHVDDDIKSMGVGLQNPLNWGKATYSAMKKVVDDPGK